MSNSDALGSMIAVVQQALAGAPEPRSGDRVLSPVEPVEEGEPGWYRVQRRLSSTEQDYATEGQLVRGHGPRAVTYDVLEVAVDGEVVRVRTSVTAPRERLSLTIKGAGLRKVLQGLVDGLDAGRSNPLLRPFTTRALTPVRPDPALSSSAHAWSSLRPGQQEAVAACCAPGLQLVWGPPGTGKTHVIATSISHLVRSGRRVLLVSNTNIAVDTALEQALRLIGTDTPGVAVRVGNTLLPSLQADDRVQLDRLVRAHQAKTQRRVDELSEELAALAVDGSQLTRVEAQLEGFDATAFQRAAQRVATRHEYERVTSELGTAEAELGLAKMQARDAEHQRLALVCRQTIDHEAQLTTDLGSIEAALTAHTQAPFLTRVRHPGTKAKLRALIDALHLELAQATVARRQAREAASAAGADPDPPVLADEAQVKSALRRAADRLNAATTQREQLQNEARRLSDCGLSTSTDRTLVAAEQDRWRLFQRLPALRAAAAQTSSRQREVERDYERALRQLRDEKQGLEKKIVAEAQVVATTLTQIALRPWLTATAYDHVIVDEAAAVPLPHVVHAVSRATTGAVLVGDYLQNGPIADQSFPGGKEAQKLFKTECFGYFDVTDPAQAQDTAGCVVLTEQFRFGPALTDLANRVAYRGLLTTAGAGQSDIVVVTADGLPEDITAIHRSSKHAGWWLIGALLARALAEHHNDAGAKDAFGVVVPYTAQAEATRAALEDSGLALLTPVGTSHAFQGRQFEVVVADLVEDGRGRMIDANLGGNDYNVDSVRLFNVAATRARQRLYVLVGRGALERTKKGPLADLNRMVQAGTAHRVDADRLLGLIDSSPPPPDSPGADLIAALAPYVRVAGLHDEDGAITEIIERIDAAQRSVWCWSAWVGRHAEGIIGALERAHQRGVTVHVVARPEREVQGSNADSLRRLVARLPHVVRMRDMHQKIVVVDEQWSIIGSFNSLSYGSTSSRRIRDLMVTMDGARFADQLLRQELALELAQRRLCLTCNAPLIECGLTGRKDARGWAWHCPPPCNEDRGTVRMFPGSGSQGRPHRNQREST